MLHPDRDRRVRAWILAAFLAASAPAARADSLWYNGDYDNRDATSNIRSQYANNGGTVTSSTSLVYDNFIVPAGQSWTITGVYSNNQIAFRSGGLPTTAYWEIRSGVSANNGGQLLFSGDTMASVVSQSEVSGDYYAAPPYQVTATVNSVVLNAGTYWLAVAPDSDGYYNEQSYIETTSGQNAVGMPPGNDGNSYTSYSGPNGTVNFAPAGYDYSMGVNGTLAVAVPAPPSLALIGLGLSGAAIRLRTRRPSAIG